MNKLWHIARRSACYEWRFIASSGVEKLLLFGLPSLVVAVVWLTFSNAQIRDLPIGVFDQDNSQLSRTLIRAVEASPSVSIKQYYRSKAEVMQALQSTEDYGIVIIPKDFSRTIKRGDQSSLTLKVNAQYGTHSGIIQYGVSSAALTFAAGITQKRLQVLNASTDSHIPLMPITVKSQQAFGQVTNYQRFLANNIIPALLHILTAVIGVGIIGRELRNKTIGRWFGWCTKPYAKDTTSIGAICAALLGKSIWAGIIFSGWMSVCLILIQQQNTTSLGNTLITMLNAWCFMIISLWLGIFLATFSASMRAGLSLAGMIAAPALSFSGVTYPMSSMPLGAQRVGEALPLTHYLRTQAAHMQGSSEWYTALPTVGWFMVSLIVIIVLAGLCSKRVLGNSALWGKR